MQVLTEETVELERLAGHFALAQYSPLTKEKLPKRIFDFQVNKLG